MPAASSYPSTPLRLFLSGQDLVVMAVMATLVVAVLLVQQDHDRQERQAIDGAFHRSLMGADPVMQDAIAQVGACELQADATFAGRRRGWSWAQRTVWVPCVQQGMERLRGHHAEDRSATLSARLQPVVVLLSRRYPEGR